MEENTTQSSSSNMMMPIIGVILLLLLAGAGYWYYSNNMAPKSPTAASTSNRDEESSPANTTTQASPNAMTESSSASAEVAIVNGVQTITVDGGNFYFKPNEIKVKKDMPVKILFQNVQGFHDFVIDDLNVKTKQITAGSNAEVEFTPDEAGNFEFYCSVGQHRSMGMKGTLVVES